MREGEGGRADRLRSGGRGTGTGLRAGQAERLYLCMLHVQRGRERGAMGVTFATCSKVASAGQDALYIESFKRNESQ